MESGEEGCTLSGEEGNEEVKVEENAHLQGDCKSGSSLGFAEGREQAASPVDEAVFNSFEFRVLYRQLFPSSDPKAGVTVGEEARRQATLQLLSSHAPNSAFFKNKLRKAKEQEAHLEALCSRKAVLKRRLENDAFAKAEFTARVSRASASLLATAYRGRVFLHVDLDMFYCAVELLQQPALKEVPFAVGSSAMLCTANYEARKFGVRAAMPGFIAKTLCPRLVILKPNFGRYTEVSARIREALLGFDSSLRMHSLDEASLDVTAFALAHKALLRERAESPELKMEFEAQHTKASASTRQSASAAMAVLRDRFSKKCKAVSNCPGERHAPEEQQTDKSAGDGGWGFLSCLEAAALAGLVREAVTRASGGLSCSAGVAGSRLLAKVCSDVNKPNSQFVLGPGAQEAFLQFLDVRKLPGVGPQRQRQLEALGVRTCQELRDQAPLLFELLPGKTGLELLRLAFGLDRVRPGESREAKSLGCEETFAPTALQSKLNAFLGELCRAVSKQLREAQLEADRIVLKVKFADFSVRSLTTRLSEPTTKEDVFRGASSALLKRAITAKAAQEQREIAKAESTCPRIRLLGVRCAGLRASSGFQQGGSRSLREFFAPFSSTPTQPPSVPSEKSEDGLDDDVEDLLKALDEDADAHADFQADLRLLPPEEPLLKKDKEATPHNHSPAAAEQGVVEECSGERTASSTPVKEAPLDRRRVCQGGGSEGLTRRRTKAKRRARRRSEKSTRHPQPTLQEFFKRRPFAEQNQGPGWQTPFREEGKQRHSIEMPQKPRREAPPSPEVEVVEVSSTGAGTGEGEAPEAGLDEEASLSTGIPVTSPEVLEAKLQTLTRRSPVRKRLLPGGGSLFALLSESPRLARHTLHGEL